MKIPNFHRDRFFNFLSIMKAILNMTNATLRGVYKAWNSRSKMPQNSRKSWHKHLQAYFFCEQLNK